MFTKEETNLPSTANVVGYTPPLGTTLHPAQSQDVNKREKNKTTSKGEASNYGCIMSDPLRENWKGMQCKS
jgi:hypothetical protein